MRLNDLPGKEFLYFLGGTLLLVWAGYGAVSHLYFRSLLQENRQALRDYAELAAARLGVDTAANDQVAQLAGLVFDSVRLEGPKGTLQYQYPVAGSEWANRTSARAVRERGTRFDPRAVSVVEVPTPGGGTLSVSRYDARLMDRHQAFRRSMAGYALAGYALFAVGGVFITRRRGRASRMLRVASTALFGGDYGVRVPVPDHPDFQPLARNLNRIAEHFGERLAEVRIERDRLRTLFGALTDSVFAIDNDEKLVDLNRAASRYFKVAPQTARRRPLAEIVRQPDLNQFVRRVLRTAQPAEAEFPLFVEGRERIMHVSGTPFALAADNDGALFVLHDITEKRRLESHRTDFVANVSHELRTPITSIKGYSETLRDGAIQDPATAKRFLNKIVDQSDRLFQLIQDLLSLAKLESISAEEGDELQEQVALDILLESAAFQCAGRAEQCGVRVTTVGGGDEAAGNANLLEQAIINLMDNAIKYSPRGGEVRVVARVDNGHAEIHVHDEGPGIAAEHHERLFERFYLVDKARSEALGGTGLGLSIVKHIMQLHQGTVSVESSLGKGSIFTMEWPVTTAQPAAGNSDQRPAVFS